MENIVLVGPTGNGKSSTGNSIVGKPVFATKSDEAGVTMECKSKIVETPDGRPKLRVIDTPGLLDLSSSADYISKEITRCLHLAEGGLHAVLLVLSVKNRLTKEDEMVLSTLKVRFGSNIVEYLIVVFTGGDVLEDNNETIKSYLDGCPDFLKRLLESNEQRMVVFDNKTENEGKKTKQFQELLNTIDLVRKHTNYKPYTKDMYHKIMEMRPPYFPKNMGWGSGSGRDRGAELPPQRSGGRRILRKGMTPSFEPKLTESVLLQMRSKTEAQKAREDRQYAEEERHLEEMQNEIDRMQ